MKQAGAELCQAHFKLGYLNVKVYKANSDLAALLVAFGTIPVECVGR